MGASKIVFVGAVAVIIGISGLGLKKGEQKSSAISIEHFYQFKAKTLAEHALQIVARKLPNLATGTLPIASSTTVLEPGIVNASLKDTSKYTYSVATTGTSGQLQITTTGTSGTQKITMVTIIKEMPPPPGGEKPAGVKTWNRKKSGSTYLGYWEQVSSLRTLSTVP